MPDSSDIKTKAIDWKKKKNQPFSRGKNHLVVIGIDEYEHLENLQNAVRDAKALVKLLLEKYCFEQSHLIELYNKDATYDHIDGLLRKLKTVVKPGDNLLIYFSGHGHYDDDKEEGFWIPTDASRDRIRDYYPYNYIVKSIKKIPSQHTFLIVDSCYSGAVLVKKTRSLRPYDPREADPSRWILASGRNEVVSDGKPGANSPFAAALLDTLRRHAHKGIPVISLVDKVTTDLLHNNTDVLPNEDNRMQRPIGRPLQGIGDKGGQFVFHPRVIAPSDKPEKLPSQESKSVEISAWDEWNKLSKSAHPSLKSVKAFMDKYPDGMYHSMAKQLYDKLHDFDLWKKAESEDTIVAYQAYIASYTDSGDANFYHNANRKIEKLLAKKLKTAKTCHTNHQYEKAITIWTGIIDHVGESKKPEIEALINEAKEAINIRLEKEKAEKERKKKLGSLKEQITKLLASADQLYDENEYSGGIEKLDAAMDVGEQALAIARDQEKAEIEQLVLQLEGKKNLSQQKVAIEKGEQLYKQDDLAGALQAFEQALSLTDETEQEKINTKVEELKGLIQQQKEAAERERKRRQKLKDALQNADTLFEQGEFREAIKAWTSALKWANKKESSKIEAQIQEAKEKDKQHKKLKKLLKEANAYNEEKAYQSAIDNWEKALELADENQKGEIRKQIKSAKKTLRAAEEEANQEKKRKDQFYKLKNTAKDHWQNKNYQAAVDWYQKALKIAKPTEKSAIGTQILKISIEARNNGKALTVFIPDQDEKPAWNSFLVKKMYRNVGYLLYKGNFAVYPDRFEYTYSVSGVGKKRKLVIEFKDIEKIWKKGMLPAKAVIETKNKALEFNFGLFNSNILSQLKEYWLAK